MKKIIFICYAVFFGLVQLNAQSISLVSYSQSFCDHQSNPYRLRSRIISQNIMHDTLTLEIAHAATCCLRYTPMLKYDKDTLYIDFGITDDSPDPCKCECCYTFFQQIKGISTPNIAIKLNNEAIFLSNEKYKKSILPPVFNLYKEDTVNVRDKYGMMQGVWIIGGKEVKDFELYEDDISVGKGVFYPNGKKKEQWNHQTNLYTAFYPSGKIKEQCILDKDYHKTFCQQWKRNGKPIKNR